MRQLNPVEYNGVLTWMREHFPKLRGRGRRHLQRHYHKQVDTLAAAAQETPQFEGVYFSELSDAAEFHLLGR